MVWASAGWSDETRAYMATCVVFMMSASFLHVASVVHTSLVWTQRPRRWCDAGWQPLADELQKGPIIDTYTQHVQQPGVVHMVEDALDIGLHQIPIPSVLQVEG